MQKPDKDFPELAYGIRRMVRNIYPNAPCEMLEQMARDHFIDAIRDPNIQFMVQYKEPATLDQAVLTAIKVNARARSTSGDEAKSGKKVSFCRAIK